MDIIPFKTRTTKRKNKSNDFHSRNHMDNLQSNNVLRISDTWNRLHNNAIHPRPNIHLPLRMDVPKRKNTMETNNIFNNNCYLYCCGYCD